MTGFRDDEAKTGSRLPRKPLELFLTINVLFGSVEIQLKLAMRSVTWLLKKQTRSTANTNQGGFPVLETQIADWRSCRTPAVSSAASCLMFRSQLNWPTYLPAHNSGPSLKVNSWTSLHCGGICCFIKTTSVSILGSHVGKCTLSPHPISSPPPLAGSTPKVRR